MWTKGRAIGHDLGNRRGALVATSGAESGDMLAGPDAWVGTRAL